VALREMVKRLANGSIRPNPCQTHAWQRVRLFRATFGGAPRAAASAPGRVNLIGEPHRLQRRPRAAGGVRGTHVRAVGPGEPGILEMGLHAREQVARIDYRAGRLGGWGAYARG